MTDNSDKVETSRIMINKVIVDLEIKNMSNELKLYFKECLDNTAMQLEEKIDVEIKQAFSNQKDKISWGMEVLRFAIVGVLFIISIKTVGS